MSKEKGLFKEFEKNNQDISEESRIEIIERLKQIF